MESLSTILHNIAAPAAIVGAVFLVLYLVKSIADYTTQKGKKTNPVGIAVGAIVILLCIGLIYVVCNDFDSVQRVFADLAGTGVDTFTDATTDVMSPENVDTSNVAKPEPITE